MFNDFFLLHYKKIYLSCCVLFVLWLAACSSDNPQTPTNPILYTVENYVSYVGDTIIVYGNYLGYPNPNSYIAIDNIIINSTDCIKWNYSAISLIVPPNTISGNIYVVIGTDTTNKLNIVINKTVPFNMIEIPSGTFTMGSNSGNSNEQPVDIIKITNSFYMSDKEISQCLWLNVMDSNPSIMNNSNKYPVHNVSWLQAILFCNKLSDIYNYEKCYTINGEDIACDFNKNGFRLPTEAEWEYTCRAGSNSDFSGSQILDLMGWYNNNSGFIIHLPGQKKQNSFGLYDMHGNVWEWCWDFYDENYYATRPNTDPLGPDNGSIHVIRGGAYTDGSFYARSSNRTFPNTNFEQCGFRIVRNK